MAELDGDRTVIVDRDRADRTMPSGVIILLVILVLAVLFFLFGGMNLFNGGTTGGSTGGVSTQVETPTTTTPTQTGSGQ